MLLQNTISIVFPVVHFIFYTKNASKKTNRKPRLETIDWKPRGYSKVTDNREID